MKVVLVGVVVLAFAGGASVKELNVSQPERDVLSGRVIYSTICIRCHGVDGKGDGQMKFTPPVADLTSLAVQGKLDARLFKSVHDGKPNTAMGAWRESLSDDEIWDALAYVRTLAPQQVTAWAAGFDEIDALPDHVGAVDRDDWGCWMGLRAGVDDAGHRWTDANRVGTGRARPDLERDADAFEGSPWRGRRLGRPES